MTNRSWKVNNHGFDFRKRKNYFGFQEKETHYFVISQLPDRLLGLHILLFNWDQMLFTVGIIRLRRQVGNSHPSNAMIKNVLSMPLV